MPRLIIPALVALLFSGPAWAEEIVWLHCNGDYSKYSDDGNLKERGGDVATISMARNGAWMELGGERLKRDAKGSGYWIYSRDENNAKIQFTVNQMKFFFSAETKGTKIYRYLYCFPITNPFLPYVE